MLYLTLKQAIVDTIAPGTYPHMADEDPSSEWNMARFRAELVTKWPLVAYLMTALFCLGLSTTCHLCYVRNENVSKLVTNLDYWGIALLFLGSCYPLISFKYACGPFIVWRYIFISVITVLTMLCMWVSVQKSVNVTPERRAFLFVLFFLSCMVPLVMLYLWYDPQYCMKPELGDYKIPFFCYVAGLVFYVLRVPERWSKTGKFDLLGASHQWFHVLVLLGIGATF